MVRSHAVEFNALPGVCIRAYDILFGSKGLSICHFTRISQTIVLPGLNRVGSNFDNLSASAEFTKAPPAGCLEDAIDAARGCLGPEPNCFSSE
ncbi:Hypothetical protein PHPALM_19632 [Phytophthora palmivora]|uniref:Uncharacterized protein n=1 Tax=Phytophthora palmivora TaxID=4796 RepID=A0A2P4XGY6_9STRA|nr:Hypothetical protein PHPALM_19632 [Phytophthora palmivora]